MNIREKKIKRIFNRRKKRNNKKIKTNQDLVYRQKKNSYHLSMPNTQYVHDKNQEEKQANQLILMAMNDHYTKMKKITKQF